MHIISNTGSDILFLCPKCQAKAWGKPNLEINCRPCREPMLPSLPSLRAALNDNDPQFFELLRGAEAVAAFLFGSGKFRRRVYHLKATSNLPVFNIGSMICARKSVLLKWIKEQEERRRASNNRKSA